jgi:peptide-methionine (S)-S-oxide reductase
VTSDISDTNELAPASDTETAVLASGCFWGAQELLRSHPGVISNRTGYSGDDHVPNASYRHHGDHAESVEVVFDPTVLSYRRLLEIFFQLHDPTTLNRQGNDIGRSYRSAIFTTTPEQYRVARETIEAIDRSGAWPGPVVTEITPAGDFWEAEPEHQDYLKHHPNGYSCHFVRPDWKLPAT